MITNYQLYNNPENTHPVCVRPYEDGVWLNKFIPLNEGNSEYQEYLSWVAEGNSPLAATNNDYRNE